MSITCLGCCTLEVRMTSPPAPYRLLKGVSFCRSPIPKKTRSRGPLEFRPFPRPLFSLPCTQALPPTTCVFVTTLTSTSPLSCLALRTRRCEAILGQIIPQKRNAPSWTERTFDQSMVLGYRSLTQPFSRTRSYQETVGHIGFHNGRSCPFYPIRRPNPRSSSG